jgi:hypothetical protein
MGYGNANSKALAYVYFEGKKGRRTAMRRLTRRSKAYCSKRCKDTGEPPRRRFGVGAQTSPGCRPSSDGWQLAYRPPAKSGRPSGFWLRWRSAHIVPAAPI